MLSNEVPVYEKLFKGDCFAVGVFRRGGNQQHACFDVLTVGADGDWVVVNSWTSCHWMPELLRLLEEAKNWLDGNATPYAYGWLFDAKRV